MPIEKIIILEDNEIIRRSLEAQLHKHVAEERHAPSF
jgi:hypothetical protein